MANKRKIPKSKDLSIRCAECKTKKVHLGDDGRPFLGLNGQPILYDCPCQQYAFGVWQTVNACKGFKK